MKVVFEKLRTPAHLLSLLVDIFMLVVLMLDLLWLMFDAVYNVEYVRNVLTEYTPRFSHFYGEVIHPNFLFFDGFVVLLFLSEFFIRWAIAIYRKEHTRWFFYPIVHWYDLLGCMPMGELRLLRLFRVWAMVYRLYQWEVLDMRNAAWFKTIAKYYNILMEEIADRVAVRLLREVRTEMQRGKPLVDEIIDEVIKPHKQELIHWTARSIETSIRLQYNEHRAFLQKYVYTIVQNAMTNNREVANLEKIPVVGGYITDNLREAVASIVFGVFDRLMNDLTDDGEHSTIHFIIENITEILIGTPAAQLENPSLAAQIVNESIDLIIKRIDTKHWKKDFLAPEE